MSLDVERINRLLNINIYDVESFRADVRIDFDEHGEVLDVTLLNPAPHVVREHLCIDHTVKEGTREKCCLAEWKAAGV